MGRGRRRGFHRVFEEEWVPRHGKVFSYDMVSSKPYPSSTVFPLEDARTQTTVH